jgi:hypothetical protein
MAGKLQKTQKKGEEELTVVNIDEIDRRLAFIDYVNVRNGVIVAGYENRNDWGGGSNGRYSEP